MTISMTSARLQRGLRNAVKAAAVGSLSTAIFNFVRTVLGTSYLVEMYDGTTVRIRAEINGMPTISGGRLVFPVDYPTASLLQAYAIVGASRCRVVTSAGAGVDGTLGLTGSGSDFIVSSNPSAAKGLTFSMSFGAPAGIDGVAPAGSNGMWIYTNTLAGQSDSAVLTVLNQMNNFGISNIYWQMGWPNQSNNSLLVPPAIPAGMMGLRTDVTPAEVTRIKNLMNQVNPGMRVHAWFGTWNSITNDHDGANIDIRSASVRAAAISAMVQFAASRGFHGIQDDTEDIQPNSNHNGADQYGALWNQFTNEFADAAHAAGLLHAPFIPASWANYADNFVSGLTQPDYLIMALDSVSVNESDWLYVVRSLFNNAVVPWNVNLTGFGRAVMPEEMRRLDLVPYASVRNKIVGYSLYMYDEFQAGDWVIWNNFRAAHP